MSNKIVFSSLEYIKSIIFSFDTKHSNHTVDTLTVLSVGYILLPNLLFFVGWFKWSIAALLTVATILIYLDFSKKTAWKRPTKTIQYGLYLLVALAWCYFGGIGHFSYANSDWLVRDALYGDLIWGQWPAAYATENGVLLSLRSAIGYFLIPAYFSSFFGLQYADVLLYIWTVIGLTLFICLLPFSTLTAYKKIIALCIVILFSGMDIVGILITTGSTPIFPLRLAWWTSFHYPSLTAQLFWAPNHVLPLWIGSALFFRHWGKKDIIKIGLLYAPLTLIWTPFASIALFPFFLFASLPHINFSTIRSSTLYILYCILIATPVISFLISGSSEISSKTGIEHAGEEKFLQTYLLFILVSFFILALFLSVRLTHSFGLFGLSVIILLILPFLFLGPSNDLNLRVSAPPLIFLMLLTINTTLEPEESLKISKPSSLPLIIVLCLGAVTPIHEIWRGMKWPNKPANYNNSLAETQNNGQLPSHYVMNSESTYIKNLLKSPKKIPMPHERISLGNISLQKFQDESTNSVEGEKHHDM